MASDLPPTPPPADATPPVDLDDHGAILAYGSDALDTELDRRVASAIEESPIADLVEALKDVQQALYSENQAELRKAVGFIGRLMGEDIELEARSRQLKSRMGVLLAAAGRKAEALASHQARLGDLQASLSRARGELLDRIDAGRGYLERHPGAGLVVGRIVSPRDRFEQRLQHLAAVLFNHEIAARQLDLMYAQTESLVSRYARIRDVLMPALRQGRVATAESMKMAIEYLDSAPWPAGGTGAPADAGTGATSADRGTSEKSISKEQAP